MKTMTRIAILVIIGFTTLAAASAQFAKPEEAIKYRQSVMFLIGQHFKRMGAVIKGETPYDQAAFATDAKLVQTLAMLPWDASLMPGSDKGDTTMSAAVFDKPEAFMKVARDFEAAAAQLAAASAGGDAGALKAPFGATAQSCKACHQAFRK
jgi:cytochrome c556